MRNLTDIQPYSDFTHVFDCYETEHRSGLVALIDSFGLEFEVDHTNVYCSPDKVEQFEAIAAKLGISLRQAQGPVKTTDQTNLLADQLIAELVRNPDEAASGIAYALVTQHRTNQRAAVETLVDALRKYGTLVVTDARNQAPADYCRALPETGFPLI